MKTIKFTLVAAGVLFAACADTSEEPVGGKADPLRQCSTGEVAVLAQALVGDCAEDTPRQVGCAPAPADPARTYGACGHRDGVTFVLNVPAPEGIGFEACTEEQRHAAVGAVSCSLAACEFGAVKSTCSAETTCASSLACSLEGAGADAAGCMLRRCEDAPCPTGERCTMVTAPRSYCRVAADGSCFCNELPTLFFMNVCLPE